MRIPTQSERAASRKRAEDQAREQHKQRQECQQNLAEFRRAAKALAEGVVERSPDMAGSLLTAASRVLELESKL